MASGQGAIPCQRSAHGTAQVDTLSDIEDDKDTQGQDLQDLRDNWVKQPLPPSAQQLRDVVVGHPPLERAWTRYATCKGLGTWMEVTDADAALFQSTCATVLENLNTQVAPCGRCLSNGWRRGASVCLWTGRLVCPAYPPHRCGGKGYAMPNCSWGH